MAYEPPRPYRGLAKIIAKVCDDRGEPYPWNKPPLHVDLPDVPDNATPGQIMLGEAAAHRQFMESVTSPPPRILALGSTFADGSRRPVAEPKPEHEPAKQRSLSEIAQEAQAKALWNTLPGREPNTGRGRGYGR